MEGSFSCESYYKEYNDDEFLKIFKHEREKYRWNTYIKLKYE